MMSAHVVYRIKFYSLENRSLQMVYSLAGPGTVTNDNILFAFLLAKSDFSWRVLENNYRMFTY